MRFVFNLLILSVFRHYFTDSNCNILNDISHFYVNHTAVSFNSSDEEKSKKKYGKWKKENTEEARMEYKKNRQTTI